MSESNTKGIAIVGGGPAGLMAAESALAAGFAVDLYETKGSVGRKFLLAGKGGLNLTHGEAFDSLLSRYGTARELLEPWLRDFDAQALRAWAADLGIDTFEGSSGRIFPSDMKAAPLLRGWVRRLRNQGLRLHVNHRCIGIDGTRLRFETPDGEREIEAAAVVLALGGGSWPQLGSDGAWQSWLARASVPIAPLQASNCGFDVAWSEHFASGFAGMPVKPVIAQLIDVRGRSVQQQGEFVISEQGVEGGLIYALSAPLRELCSQHGSARLHLDLMPGRDEARLARDIARQSTERSLSERLRRGAGIRGVKAGLLREGVARDQLTDPRRLAAWLKAVPLTLLRPRPLAESISSAGGVSMAALDQRLMLPSLPGVFYAGEMLDWEAPTGGYLLSASLATGRGAGLGAAAWLRSA